MEPIIEVTESQLCAAFTEWDRRWREEPDRFQSESEHLASTTDEYGKGASKYLIKILGEQKQ